MIHNYDFMEALYCFCMDYHSSQWSRGYRILSRLSKRLKLSPLFKGYESLGDEGKSFYDSFVEKYANKI